jgi:hypothetical protein
MRVLREMLLQHEHIRAIQEDLAGFLMREVLNPKGSKIKKYYVEDGEQNT